MLVHCLWRCTSIIQALVQRLLFPDVVLPHANIAGGTTEISQCTIPGEATDVCRMGRSQVLLYYNLLIIERALPSAV